jgi:hypothetical protein
MAKDCHWSVHGKIWEIYSNDGLLLEVHWNCTYADYSPVVWIRKVRHCSLDGECPQKSCLITVRRLIQKNASDLKTVSRYNPRANGQAESGVAIAERILKRIDLIKALMNYRSTPVQSIFWQDIAQVALWWAGRFQRRYNTNTPA